jgi:hypothetical protein
LPGCTGTLIWKYRASAAAPLSDAISPQCYWKIPTGQAFIQALSNALLKHGFDLCRFESRVKDAGNHRPILHEAVVNDVRKPMENDPMEMLKRLRV